MGLRTTSVAKCLEKKLLLFGFEVLDVLAVFLTLSILNFIFGQAGQVAYLKFCLVWVPTLLLAATLRLGKKGKPDNYLIHWFRFQLKPGTYRAFPDSSQWKRPPHLEYAYFYGHRGIA